MGFLGGIFGGYSERFVRQCRPVVAKINALKERTAALSDSELRAKTAEFKRRVEQGESLDALLPEAFAVTREGAKRALGLFHFDVQLIGGMILHKGMIAEMRTGEGKTLVGTLAVYLNALAGKGVHVITVNDYLARRDAMLMGRVYQFLGLSVGCITGGMRDEERRLAYHADITYGTNNEFGFDYLRDNMKFVQEEMCQRELNFAIVDEIDSILIDEARTPLIISGQAEQSSELYVLVDVIIPLLDPDDYELDEKHRSVALTDKGAEHAEELLRAAGLITDGQNLFDIAHITVLHHFNQALNAHKLYTRDKDYIVRDGKVIIIDEFTGRMMEDRRFSDGLHQALEAKERQPIQNENQTLATVTFQNYFRMYGKLAGMTGTAKTEEREFGEIYGLRVIDVPTNRQICRNDEDDVIYRTVREKNEAIVKEIADCVARKQPVLVGTVSIEKSEKLSELLHSKGIPHQVLNAKHHMREAEIIADAGRPGGVTIATNMAGRGTDIMLGGGVDNRLFKAVADRGLSEEEIVAERQRIEAEVEDDKQAVLAAGGLYVLGTERHESRRIDNQLRGRAGRQGDPGRSKFFLSLEDDLMRIFGSEKLRDSSLMKGLEEGEVITHPWLSRVIAKAQHRVERHHFDTRKNLLRFDSVMNEQRTAIYEQRREFIRMDDVSEILDGMAEDVMYDAVALYVPKGSYHEDWDLEGLEREAHRLLGLRLPIREEAAKDNVTEKELANLILEARRRLREAKAARFTEELMRLAEKKVLLLTLDQLWKDHLLALDHLKQGIGLRAYGQKDPLGEYKREAFRLFELMTDTLRSTVVTRAAHLELSEEDRRYIADYSQFTAPETNAAPSPRSASVFRAAARPFLSVGASSADDHAGDSVSALRRNQSCSCGSGKKYKNCCGALSQEEYPAGQLPPGVTSGAVASEA